MWSTQMFVLDEDGGEVISVTTADEKPHMKKGQLVVVSALEALPWATNGRDGVTFKIEEGDSTTSQVRVPDTMQHLSLHGRCVSSSIGLRSKGPPKPSTPSCGLMQAVV